MKSLIVVSSISASGKTTLVDNAIDKFRLYKLKTCTTREVREEEKGDEYHFLSLVTFLAKIAAGAFVEHAIVYQYYYGLTRHEVEVNSDKNSIIITDVQGAKTLKELYPHAVTIFIKPPSMDEVLSRLSERETGSIDSNNRYNEAEKELEQMGSFDYTVESGTREDMRKEFEELISVRCVGTGS
jgi:guanylate kinase